ncbi:MAG: YbhB/YbcL family Raf kinase inhibitor-like protein [Chloroflexota bacterium]
MTLPGRGAALIAMGLLVATLWTSTAAHAAPHTAAPASLHAAPRAAPHPFTLTSRVFHDGGALPSNAALNTDGCNGANRLPTLAWTGVPTGTRSFALLIVDPDAAPAIPSGWVHGNVYNIPPAVRILTARSLGRYTSGTTSFGHAAFGGPCPPSNGQPHHYIFTLYALKIAHLAPGLTRDQVLAAASGHILGATTLVGTFHRG